MRLIDADAIQYDQLLKTGNKKHPLEWAVSQSLINCMPTIKTEPKRGRWKNGKCSICGEHAPFWMMASTYYESPYCPSCGAKMDEVEE